MAPAGPPQKRTRPLPRASPRIGPLVLAAALGVALVFVAVAWKSSKPVRPIALPPAPAVETRYTPGFYRALLMRDAAHYDTSVPDVTVPLQHIVELDRARPLRPGEELITPHLSIGAYVRKVAAENGSGQGFAGLHLVVAIANRSSTPLAYRVETAVDSERCSAKGSIAHNAVALSVGERAERTECLWGGEVALTVQRIEVIELSPLSYYYVSRLEPSQIGLDARPADGHLPPKDAVCTELPRQEILTAGATWPDVIDFYARHNCSEYTFYQGYRLRTAPGPLPAHE